MPGQLWLLIRISATVDHQSNEPKFFALPLLSEIDRVTIQCTPFLLVIHPESEKRVHLNYNYWSSHQFLCNSRASLKCRDGSIMSCCIRPSCWSLNLSHLGQFSVTTTLYLFLWIIIIKSSSGKEESAKRSGFTLCSLSISSWIAFLSSSFTRYFVCQHGVEYIPLLFCWNRLRGWVSSSSGRYTRTPEEIKVNVTRSSQSLLHLHRRWSEFVKALESWSIESRMDLNLWEIKKYLTSRDG